MGAADKNPTYKADLDKATAALGKYFGVLSKDDFLGKLTALENLDSTALTDPAKPNAPSVQEILEMSPQANIAKFFLTVSEGAHLTKDIIAKLETYVTDGVDFGDGKDPAVVTGDAAKIKGWFDIIYEPAVFEANAKAKECCCIIHPENTVPADRVGKPASMREMVTPVAPNPDTPKNPGATKDEEGTPPIGVNSAPDAPTSAAPSLAAFMVHPARLSPAHRDTGAVSLFMNLIPTIELSRCVPYLNIQFINNQPALDDKGRPSGMALYTFLQGRKQVDGGADGVDGQILGGVPVGMGMLMGDDEEAKKMSYAGMELFTVPQSMINADEPEFVVFADYTTTDPKTGVQSTEADAIGGPRSAPVIDKFRPFASVDGLGVSVTPAGGMMCHKTAEMNVTLHDRSRLGEISEFVRPALYGGTHMLIEYGWSHPDGGPSSTNPIGQFLNALRVKEKYQVVNSDFKFDDAGQVSIGLKLSMLGLVDIDKGTIGSDDTIGQAKKEIEKLTRVIRQIKRKVSGTKSGAKSVSGTDFLGKVSSFNSSMQLDADTIKEIQAYMKKSKDAEAGSTGEELRGALEGLLGEDVDGTGGKVGSLHTTIAKIINARVSLLLDPASGDPFFRTIGCAPNDDVERKFVRVQTPGTYRLDFDKDHWKFPESMLGYVDEKVSKRTFVSLGKLLSVFVGAPLVQESKHDEIQLIFYSFNPYASYVADWNIAQYPIDVDEFYKEFKKITKTDPDMSIRRFIGFIQRNFISAQHAYAWGIADQFKEGEDGNRELANEKLDATMLHDMKTKRIQDAYRDGGDAPTRDETFKPPRLAIFMEAVPVHSDSNPSDEAGETLTILKVHIYDKQCSAYTGVQQMLQASRNDSMGAINQATFTAQKDGDAATQNKTQSGQNEEWMNAIKAAMDAGLIEVLDTEGKQKAAVDVSELKKGEASIRMKGGFPALKAFVKKTMPTIIYGSQNSAILSADLSSMNDPALTSIHMMRQGQANASTSAVSQDRGVPLKVSPTQLSLDIIGCPIIRYGQQFFVDFGTGTTADNVYAVNGISHSISSGEFKTSLKMLQLDTFGKYESTLNSIVKAAETLQDADKQAAAPDSE